MLLSVGGLGSDDATMTDRLKRRIERLENAQAPKPQARKIDLSKVSDDLIAKLLESEGRLELTSEADIAELKAAGFELEGDAP